MFGLGMQELIVILVVVLLIFGPSRLPSIGKSIGEALTGFKKGLDSEPPKDDKEAGKKP